MIEVQFDDREIRKALQNLQQAAGNLAPALKEIGEVLVESTKQRFASGAGPDGERWDKNSDVTIARKGRNKPLIGETLALSAGIDYQLIGDDAVAIGSPMEYAAMQQFGGTESEFPHLWGDIPARPFLGISDDDRENILEIIREHVERALK
jgi:phage virion morphogenesis protein